MFIAIDRNSNISIKKQLYDALTFKILNKELSDGQKMPSSRQLASQLSIARNTVTEIYDQLVAEAYLVPKQGKGTFVAKVRDCKVNCQSETCTDDAPLPQNENVISLIAGVPDLNNFPKKAWQNAHRNIIKEKNANLYGYGNPYGHKYLRKSIAKYLKHHKGIHCTYQQIIITGGTKDALRMIALALNKDYKNVIIESPSVGFVQEIFKSCRNNIYPAKVDKQGIATNKLSMTTQSLLYVSPAHQFPYGGTLPIGRRQELVNYAKKHNHIILEDDYDSEFRYKGAPVNSLYQLCSDNVIHLGTFSKTLCPSIRLGYAVIPTQFLQDIKNYRYLSGNPPDTQNQAALSDLIETGAYEKHVYKMTKVYKAKMKLITTTLEEIYNGDISINGCAIGLHISIEFKNINFTIEDKPIFIKQGIDIDLASEYDWKSNTNKSNTLIMGFGHLSQEEIHEALIRLEKAIKVIKQQKH